MKDEFYLTKRKMNFLKSIGFEQTYDGEIIENTLIVGGVEKTLNFSREEKWEQTSPRFETVYLHIRFSDDSDMDICNLHYHNSKDEKIVQQFGARNIISELKKRSFTENVQKENIYAR